MITIETTENGYILRTPEHTQVFEETDTALGDKFAAVHLLYAILEEIGCYGTKHDDARVRIALVARDSGEDLLT